VTDASGQVRYTSVGQRQAVGTLAVTPRLAYESTVDGTGAEGPSRLSVDVDALTGTGTVRSFDVSAFAGQTVTVKFTGTEDSSLQTSFVVDDTALTAS
jgi:hypothetical protein